MAQISLDAFDAPLEENYLEPPPPSAARANVQAAAVNTDPDKYAKQRDIAKQAGIPTSDVEGHEAEIERQNRLGMIKLDDFDKPVHPVTDEYLANPEAAQISYDDISVLHGLEREAGRSWLEVDERTFKGMGDSMMIGMGKLYDQSAIAMLRGFQDTGDEATQAQIGMDPIAWMKKKAKGAILDMTLNEDERQIMNEKLDAQIEKHKLNLEAAEQEIGRLTPQGLTGMEESARGALQMVSDMGPGLLISAATRGKFNPTLSYLAGKTFLDSYGSAALAGKDHTTSMGYAGIDMGLEVMFERLPVKRLEAIIGEVGKGGIKSSIKRYLMTEALGEQGATATQSFNAWAHDLDEELGKAVDAKDWGAVMEIQGHRQAVTFFSTLMGGGGMAATVKGIDYLANRERRAMGKLINDMNTRRGSEFEQERLDNMIYLAQSSKTNERAADLFEDVLGKMSPDQEIFIDAEAIDLLDNPPAYLTDQIDGSGGTVSVPLATFLKDFATDDAAMEVLRPAIKTNEKFKNQTEIEEDDDGEFIKAVLAKAAEAAETKTAADTIYESLTEQLVATGRLSTAAARQSAAIIPAQVTTQYEYLKSIGYKNEDGTEVTLEQLFKDFGLEVVGPEAEITAEYMTQVPSEAEQAEARGLPMDQVSRLTRAQEQGYDVENVMYHGTREDFDQFDTADFGSWFSADVDLANSYATPRPTGDLEADAAQAPVVMPSYLKTEKTFRIPMDLNEGRRAGQLLDEINQENGTNLTIDDLAAYDENTYGGVFEFVGYNDKLIPALKALGYDSISGTERGMASINVFDPQQVRSTSAAFDPDYSESPRVLSQQNFGNIAITETVLDEAGMPLDITESANDMWVEQRQRQDSLEALRRCFNG